MSKPEWKESPWDNRVHAFWPDQIGDTVAEALCKHSAVSKRLTENKGARLCQACALLVGDTFAERLKAQFASQPRPDIDSIYLPAPRS